MSYSGLGLGALARACAVSRSTTSRSIAKRMKDSRSSPFRRTAEIRSFHPPARVRLMLSGHSFGRPMRGPISRTPMAVKFPSEPRTPYCFYNGHGINSTAYPKSQFQGMTIHFHGTPITPLPALYELRGRHFCVSHAAPQDVERCHAIGQSVMLDNGAFSAWKRGHQTDWPGYYAWTDRWLDCPTTWAVIPDEIDAGTQQQDALVREWPHGKRQASPVWHMDEPIHRLLALCDAGWSRVCIGSTDEYRVVLSPAWEARMDEAFGELERTFGRRVPPVHMLRGMQCSGRRWPFASVDSTDIAQNHNRPQNTPRAMADRWDAMQCGPTREFTAGSYGKPRFQIPLFEGAA